MKIQKRDGRVVPYEEEKIREAIHKANNEVEERYRASEGLIEEILEDVQQEGRQTQTVEHIQDMIEEHLVEHNKYTLAKKYIVYRYQRSLLRKSNTTDESILKLIRNENKELCEENSNKNTRLASTQRDYIAGEVSRDVTRRLLLPEHIAMAHDNGVLHFHDADYFIQPIFNCCLINIKAVHFDAAEQLRELCLLAAHHPAVHLRVADQAHPIPGDACHDIRVTQRPPYFQRLPCAE